MSSPECIWKRLRRIASDERGMVTVEAAYAIAAIVVTVLIAVGGVSAMIAQIRCTDAAREAARLAARGDDAAAHEAASRLAPDGAQVEVRTEGDHVVAVVTAPAGLLPLDLRGEAIAAVEPGE